MKVSLLIIILIVDICWGIYVPEHTSEIDAQRLKFNKFKEDFNKKYASLDEEAKRFSVFTENLRRIDHLNSLGSSATFGINHFADMSAEEFRSSFLGHYPATRDPTWPEAAELKVNALPESIDWREKGAVTPVKNQGSCGSCWAFSTTGNVEGQWYLAGNTLTSLSEQNLVDCDHECMEYENQKECDQGCGGGLQPNAYNYIIKNGIDTETSYPYKGRNGQCSYNPSNSGAKISNWTMVSKNETQMAAYLVAHGPLAIAADAVEWQFYFGGIFDIPCGKKLDHGILIVGYGVEPRNNKPYWIVKNSWGAMWGEKGYLRIARGKGLCGINEFVSSSIV